ncbi:MAG TPA: molybdenum cofactor biosynthesis protein B [Woeseiaceae bacterium]|nr:molybdenum cofactor biosynthesis protein B [Woeseiaceae bacterium]
MSKQRKQDVPFIPVRVAVLTVSDSRTLDNDTSGDTLCERVRSAGHTLAERALLPDDIFKVRATVSIWIADASIDCILITGGTGITGRDSTPEAIRPLLVRDIPGFGELFRQISREDIGAATIQSRAFAGTANATLVFALPGSPGACETAWDHILVTQLDARTRPCNFISLLSRLNES